jgi:hypothetical protein
MVQKKSPALPAGLDHSSRLNLTLAGCSSAEPASVSVQLCKIQNSNLYLQPVKILSHLPYFKCYHKYNEFDYVYLALDNHLFDMIDYSKSIFYTTNLFDEFMRDITFSSKSEMHKFISTINKGYL